MARINLLPWREEYRQEKKKEFISQLIGVGMLAGVIVFAWVLTVNGAIENQNDRNNLLQSEIDQLEAQVKEIQELKKKREQLISRMQIIQDLQGTRPTIVRYFDEMARAVPDGVFVLKLNRTGESVTLNGVAESSPRVSEFMRRLDESEWFSEPNLKNVKADAKYGEGAVLFVLSLNTVLPNADGDVNGGGNG